MAMTVKDALKSAYRKVGALEEGKELSGDQTVDGIRVLNAMLALWSSKRIPVFFYTREQFALTAGQASYTVGSGGDFNTTRPQAIASAYIIYTGQTTQYPLEPVGNDEYDSLGNLADEGMPEKFFYNPAFPLATLKLFPTPVTGLTIGINSKANLGTFTTVTDTMQLPPEYEFPIVYNLAVHLALDTGFNPPSKVEELARDYYNELTASIISNDMNSAKFEKVLTYRRFR